MIMIYYSSFVAEQQPAMTRCISPSEGGGGTSRVTKNGGTGTVNDRDDAVSPHSVFPQGVQGPRGIRQMPLRPLMCCSQCIAMLVIALPPAAAIEIRRSTIRETELVSVVHWEHFLTGECQRGIFPSST